MPARTSHRSSESLLEGVFHAEGSTEKPWQGNGQSGGRKERTRKWGREKTAAREERGKKGEEVEGQKGAVNGGRAAHRRSMPLLLLSLRGLFLFKNLCNVAGSSLSSEIVLIGL